MSNMKFQRLLQEITGQKAEQAIEKIEEMSEQAIREIEEGGVE